MILLRPFLIMTVAVTFTTCGPAQAVQDRSVSVRSTQISKVDRVIVNPAVVRRKIPSTFFGINYVGFWEPAEGSRAAARALAQTPIRTVRFPGGAPGDWYDWQDPYYQHNSRTSPMQLWHWARSFGATRVLFQTNYQGHIRNPPGKPYAVNSPQNAAAWVAYDRAHGIVADMEVGNEEDMNTLHSKDDPAYHPYLSAFNSQAVAMHRADPHVRVLGPVGTNEWYWWSLDGLGTFLRAAGNRSGTGQVNGVSLHFYKGSNWFDSMDLAQYWRSPHGPWAAIQQTIHANDTRHLPVYMTEWNLGNQDFHNAFSPTTGHAIAVADMIGSFALSGVAEADYFTLHRSDGWGLFYGTHDARPLDSPTPTYYAMALWRHMGDRMLALRQSDDAASVMSTYATRRKDGSIQLLAINKRPSPHRVILALHGASPAGHHLRVYSLSPAKGSVYDFDARYDGAFMPSTQHRLPGPRDLGIVRGRTVTYTVPPYSAVVLDLAGTTRVPGLVWKMLPPVVAVPPLHVDVTGATQTATVKPGDTQVLTAVARSNDDIGPALVDFEVYDSTGAKAFQDTRMVKLTANTSVTASRAFTLPSGIYGGPYHFKIGVFGPNWVPLFTWNDDASSFTVDAPLPPRVSVVGQVTPASVDAGSVASLTADVAVKDNSLSHALVDFEVYDGTGAKVWQDEQEGVDVSQGGSTNVTRQWTVPQGQPGGSYILKIGVFGANWKPLYVWNDKAAAMSVVGPVVSVSGKVDPGVISPGATGALTADVSITGASLRQGIVDFEIYDGAGSKVWQATTNGVNVAEGGSVQIRQQWKVPSNQASGSYVLKIGVFGSDWKPLYTWNDKAASFDVGGGTQATAG